MLRFVKDVLLLYSLCVYMNNRQNLVAKYLSALNRLEKIKKKKKKLEIMNLIFTGYPFLVIFLEKVTVSIISGLISPGLVVISKSNCLI